MHTIKDLLSRVDRVVTNSPSDTLTEIKNISNILEVDGKIATILHFVHTDKKWNPTTLPMLEDTIKKLQLKEQHISHTPEKKKEIKDFYLLNYLDRYWKEHIIKRLKEGKGLHYVNVFLRKVTGEMIADLQKLGLYPELSKDSLDDFREDDAFAGDGPSTLIYKPVSEWLREIINREELPLYKGFDYTTEEGDYEIPLTEQLKLQSKISPYWKDKIYKVGMATLSPVGNLVAQFVDYDDWPEGSYHWAIDAVSFISYVVCPYTEGIGCAISVAADALNASLYVHYDDPPDYYMAGMQMAFSIAPAGELLKNEAKFLKPYVTPLFKKGWELGLRASKETLEATVYSAVKTMPAHIIRQTKELFPKWSAKALREVFEAAQKGMNQIGKTKFLTLAFPGQVSSIVSLTKTLWNFQAGLLRAFIMFLEIIWYDPQMPGQLIEMLAGQNSVSDWLETLPKIGLKIWSGILKDEKHFRGAITTTPYDCTGRMYVWSNDELTSDKGVSIQNEWEAAIQTGEIKPPSQEFTEENVWAEWEKGWRPENYKDESIMLYKTLIEKELWLKRKYPKYLKDCMLFLQKMKSKDVDDRKMLYIILAELGITPGDLDEMFYLLDNPEGKAKR